MTLLLDLKKCTSSFWLFYSLQNLTLFSNQTIYSSLQESVTLGKVVMEENEELKCKLARQHDLKRDLDLKLVNLERENMNLENQARNFENKVP